jgi:cytochrome aa3-600 menaquinol oxidase subunit 1
MWGGRVRLTVPMLWQLAFIPTFVIAGASGVMLGAVPADYQLHNSYFLVAHFHNALIGGVVFGFLSGLYYWWPKMFGYRLNERQGRWAFWLFFLGFWVCFGPQYLLGLAGMTRRMYTYPAGLGWTALNQISTVGAFMMGAGFIALVYNIMHSMLHAERDTTGDPWDGRTLEWSLPSPAPEYNFARIPTVDDRDAWWAAKQAGRADEVRMVRPGEVETIPVPRRSAQPFLLGFSFFVLGVGMVFGWPPVGISGLAGILACIFAGWWDAHPHEDLSPETVLQTEQRLGRVQA